MRLGRTQRSPIQRIASANCGKLPNGGCRRPVHRSALDGGDPQLTRQWVADPGIGDLLYRLWSLLAHHRQRAELRRPDYCSTSGALRAFKNQTADDLPDRMLRGSGLPRRLRGGQTLDRHADRGLPLPVLVIQRGVHMIDHICNIGPPTRSSALTVGCFDNCIGDDRLSTP